ncbi:hypothetical protein TanjilG_21161 [Lupinus angustifolius]|uniref:Major facilitator superfamily (MFS) profile domain-containing protein n=1 Tax=Lupinus angustifolius TaxID=3871 RepID=A0A1J7H080_LUPAN|nr:hypothetical protein TanjilG_21161 [Lupinus angustifolius]
MGEENIRDSLLKKKYYENCPGCKVDEAKELNRGLSIRNLLIVWMVVISASLPVSSLFPFLYFMVKDFNIAKTEAKISSYAGYVGSAFLLGRTLTSVIWGLIADRYGRKPVLVIGVTSVVVFNTLFGLSTSFWMALITRFLLGSLCGVIGPVKAYASELFREEHQSIGISTVSAAWGIGLIIGPALGGYLAQETLHNHNDGNKSTDEAEALENEGGGIDKDKRIQKKENVFLNWPLMASILVYSVYSLQDIAYQEVFSLWAVSPRRLGGLTYTTDDVGNVLSISGFALIIYQVCVYPFIEKAFGTMIITRIAAMLAIPIIQSFPFIAMCSGAVLFILLSIGSVVKMVLGMTVTTGLFLIQNRVVEQHQRGEANGIAMTFMSLFTAIGPATGGAM